MKLLRAAIGFLGAACLALHCAAQSPAAERPPFATTKVAGTENVYIFRNGNHQAMFIVTGEGVIATDPIAYRRAKERAGGSTGSAHGGAR